MLVMSLIVFILVIWTVCSDPFILKNLYDGDTTLESTTPHEND